jgi:hypothetical protein
MNVEGFVKAGEKVGGSSVCVSVCLCDLVHF